MMTSIGSFSTIGELWANIAKKILNEGNQVVEETEEYKELKGITAELCWPLMEDHILDKHINLENMLWMKNNFEIVCNVSELGGAHSYAERLYSYLGEKNQIEWVVERINKKRSTRAATITTFEPLYDKTYIPCISLLDFDVENGFVNLYVYARALDFGNKAQYNLLCLVNLLERVAKLVELPCGVLHLICKSVHIYNYSYDEMISVIEELIK